MGKKCVHVVYGRSQSARVAAGVGGLISIMAACFFYIQVFAEGMPNYAFWLMSLLSQPAFAMAIDRVSYAEYRF